MRRKKVAVIGAGPCGLSACKALGEFGVDYECLEAGDGVGGIWDVERGPGGGYRSLHTNTSTRGMSFSDFPFDDTYPTYPNAAEMLRYFRSYAEAFGVAKHIRFGQRVVSATPLGGGGWHLSVEGGESRDYAALIVATGQYNTPKRPHDRVPGRFDGEHLHVFDYLDAATPVDCRGKRVLVVGLGSSAAEVAAELCDPDSSVGQASHVLLAARSGHWVLPKIMDGVPLDAQSPHPADRPPAALRVLPGEMGPWVMRRAFAKVIRARMESLGGARGLGLPEPEASPWEDRPTMSIEFIPALKEGRIDVRSGIRSFEGPTVHFEDGTSSEADVILYATGYQLGFPYLDEETLGCEAPDLALYQRIAHPTREGLFFLGCCRVMCSMWPVAEQQSRWIARHLSGAFDLPDGKTRVQRAVPLASSLPVMCNFYVDDLRGEAGGLERSES